MKNKSRLFQIFGIAVLIIFAIACKKPKSGDYMYEETGIKKSYLSEGSPTYSLMSTTPISSSGKVTIKNKSNSTLYIDDIAWAINGDSVTNRNSVTTTDSPQSNTKNSYSYNGLITGKKSIEGTFTRVQVIHSYSNIAIDSSNGTFKYNK